MRAGTITIPPPMPSNPASTPETKPTATNATVSPSEWSAVCDVSIPKNSRTADASATAMNSHVSIFLLTVANHLVPSSAPGNAPATRHAAAHQSTLS